MAKDVDFDLTKLKADDVVRLNRMLANQLDGLRVGLGVQRRLTTRFDSLLKIKVSLGELGREVTVEEAVAEAEAMEALLARVEETVDGLIGQAEAGCDEPAEGATALGCVTPALNRFVGPRWENPVDPLVDELQADAAEAGTWEQVQASALRFQAIQPYGSGLDTIHERLLDEYLKAAGRGSAVAGALKVK